MPEHAKEDFLAYGLHHGFGDVHCTVDPETGMKAIIAIHNTARGPALGGCRFIPYASSADAIIDAMRLARGMSYKSALANLPLGGGKAVILYPDTPFDRKAYFHRFGEAVQTLNGRYITALDSGTKLEDMDIIAEHTPYVASLSQHHGDPSPATAHGLLRGILAAVAFKLNKNDVAGLTIAIQGLGHVGYDLASQLHARGARLIVADIDAAIVQQAVKQFGATAVAVQNIHRVPCDVFAPCALGAIINDTTLPELQTTIIAGAANNQLQHAYHGQQLHDQGILYATDYVINAGGVIYAASHYLKTSPAAMHANIEAIYDTLINIFTRSCDENKPTSIISDQIAEEKMVKQTR